MEVLLRTLRPGRHGEPEYEDSELSVATLVLGSAADCTIQLLGEAVSAHHASIRARADLYTIACVRGARIIHNGLSVERAGLEIGDRIEIGAHRLRRFAPPAGFDLALELQPDPNVAASSYERAFRTELTDTWLSKRRAAWLLFVLVIALGLIVPYVSLPAQRAGRSPAALLPSDQFWNAGPLIAAHQVAAAQHCSACHQHMFHPVEDGACRECHRKILDHVPQAQLKLTQVGPAERCAECHQEHHAPVSGLIIRDNQLCVDCHAGSERAFGPLRVQKVSGFSLDAHPAFAVSLLQPSGPVDDLGEQAWTIRRQPVSSAKEDSNLTFSHAQHLDPAQVTRAADGMALGCADCHSLAADGEHFRPITMQRSCATGSCHKLTFDVENPDRQLPHGKPRDAIALIQDYYVRRAVDPNPERSFQRRRVPDQSTPGTLCSDPTFGCAMQRARIEIDKQFTSTGCSACHRVSDTHSQNVFERYRVAPVRLTLDYFPEVHFSHRQHAIQNDKTGDAACVSCHPVRNSTSSSELFIPNLSKCLECHSDRLTAQRITLQCGSCHRYHPATPRITSPQATREAQAP